MERLPSPSVSTLYIRPKILPNRSQDVITRIEQLENAYLSQTIQEIYIIRFSDPRLEENDQSRQSLAAIIISQANDAAVLEELEQTSKSKQIISFQFISVVIIERESQRIAETPQGASSERMNREFLENKYRTKITNTLLTHGQVSDESVKMFLDKKEHGKKVKSHTIIKTDEILHPSLQPCAKASNETCSKDILLTGSTGFLGTYLLNELLQQTDANIYCLVRSETRTPVSTSHPRVFYLCGDLTLPQLGLDDDQHSLLVSNIRSVYHCGAIVDHVKPYVELRTTNVLGTIEIIKFSCLANCRINYISTKQLLNQSDETGYVQSKRVAESLLGEARKRGLPITILRPGYISWSLSTGDLNRRDWLSLLLTDLIDVGCAPDIDCAFSMTPVDQISRVIVELGESKQTAQQTINLPETHQVNLRTVWNEICRQQMKEPLYLNVVEWRQNFDERIKEHPEFFYSLEIISKLLKDHPSEDTIIPTNLECNVNLPMFVQVLLRKD